MILDPDTSAGIVALQQGGMRVDDIAEACGATRKRVLAAFRRQGYDATLYHLETIQAMLERGESLEQVLAMTGLDLRNTYQKTHYLRLLKRHHEGRLPEEQAARRVYPSRAAVFSVIAEEPSWSPYQRLVAAMVADAIYTLDMEFLRDEDWGRCCMQSINIDQEGLLALIEAGGGHYGQALATDTPDWGRGGVEGLRVVESA